MYIIISPKRRDPFHSAYLRPWTENVMTFTAPCLIPRGGVLLRRSVWTGYSGHCEPQPTRIFTCWNVMIVSSSLRHSRYIHNLSPGAESSSAVSEPGTRDPINPSHQECFFPQYIRHPRTLIQSRMVTIHKAPETVVAEIAFELPCRCSISRTGSGHPAPSRIHTCCVEVQPTVNSTQVVE